MIKNITILGAGSAGLFTAIALRRKLPDVKVQVIRSPDIGVIGVGEGTTPLFPQMLFDYLGLKRGQFFAQAAPTWKLGGRFLWGSRGAFNYPVRDYFHGAASRNVEGDRATIARKTTTLSTPRRR
jgi:tryptophan halogenase